MAMRNIDETQRALEELKRKVMEAEKDSAKELAAAKELKVYPPGEIKARLAALAKKTQDKAMASAQVVDLDAYYLWDPHRATRTEPPTPEVPPEYGEW